MKMTPVVNALTLILDIARFSENRYHTALASVPNGEEIEQFIYFWQEHARMVAEVEDKIRWLGGTVPEEPGSGWPRFEFKPEPENGEVGEALLACKSADEELVNSYQTVLKSLLPVDVKTLLKTHVMKIWSIQAKLLKLELVHRAGRVRVDFHSRDPQDRVLGEVVLQA